MSSAEKIASLVAEGFEVRFDQFFGNFRIVLSWNEYHICRMIPYLKPNGITIDEAIYYYLEKLEAEFKNSEKFKIANEVSE